MVLMIDEFDKLQEGIDHGITSPRIPENIRYLIQNEPGFSVIITGSRRMQRLRHEYWSALYVLGSRIGVSALDEADARHLVVEPFKGRLRYSDEAIKRIIHLTARQPFLIQSVCNRITEAELDRDLKALRELELIEFIGRKGGEVYRLEVTLMGKWIDTQRDFTGIRVKAFAEQEAMQ